MTRALARQRETFADAMARGDGGRFDQLRLGGAMLVIVSHGFEITQGTRANEPFLQLSGEFTLGEIAVLIFFALSGFLLAQSLRRDASVARFAARRARRIMPGLAACVLLLVFVAGPALTFNPRTDYFDSAETYAFLANIALVPDIRTLPGVFETAPIGAAVDAPLWTLLYEVVCYGLLALLTAAGCGGPRGAAFMIIILTLIYMTTANFLPPQAAHFLRPLSVFGPVFFAGALVSTLADKTPRDGRIALLGAAAFVAASALERPNFGFLFGGVYAVLFVATSRPSGFFRRVTGGADISYGTYLYGWPIQQALVTGGLAATVGANIGVGLAAAMLAGLASCLIVERRFQGRGSGRKDQHAGRMNFLQNPPPAAAGAIKSPE